MDRTRDLLIPLLPAADFPGGGCATRPRGPDLGELYDRAARHHAPDRNPVIVIPGTLGSKLVDAGSGALAWGAFGGGAIVKKDAAPGDGTVTRAIAVMDERMPGNRQPEVNSPITWHNVMFLFSSHLGMTKGPAFSDNVLYPLLEDPRK